MLQSQLSPDITNMLYPAAIDGSPRGEIRWPRVKVSCAVFTCQKSAPSMRHVSEVSLPAPALGNTCRPALRTPDLHHNPDTPIISTVTLACHSPPSRAACNTTVWRPLHCVIPGSPIACSPPLLRVLAPRAGRSLSSHACTWLLPRTSVRLIPLNCLRCHYCHTRDHLYLGPCCCCYSPLWHGDLLGLLLLHLCALRNRKMIVFCLGMSDVD